MAHLTDEIMQILHKCHLSKDDHNDKLQNRNDSLEKIKSHAEKLLINTPNNYVGCVAYTSLNKMLATCNLKTGNELTAIHHLIESHAVILRHQILHRYQKSQIRESVLNVPQTYGLKPAYVKFEPKFSDNSLISKLSELPKEWYVLQVTVQYESSNILKHTKHVSNSMHAIHITVLPTGPSEIEPLCITLPKPAMQVSYDICTEIQNILASNKVKLEANYTSSEYCTMRKEQDNQMKMAINGLEITWLREWRVLFMADVIQDFEIVNEIHEIIDKLIMDSKFSDKISKRCKWLLKKVSTGACFLTREEIARAIKFLLPGYEKLANNIILSIYSMLPRVKKLKNVKRKTLVLIIDEHIDYLAFEAMEIIKNHPVTRFPSLHIVYALFKEHEDTIVDGCKVIKAKDNMGICIVSSSGNLHKMEKRMKVFINYWLPQWKSCYDTKPSGEIFEDALVNHDILMYNGHGNGIQYLSGEDIERTKVKSTVLLFGCNSIRLLLIGGRYPPYGVTNQYLIACSPCLLGMLWEITDLDIDKMTTDFMSKWIPSTSNKIWTDVDINSWAYGNLKFTKNTEKKEAEVEPEMLRAVAKSKKVCLQYMTAAAIVVRGLPTKIV